MEGNSDGTVGGSHRALVDLVLGVDRSRFEPVVLFYQDNRHVPALRAAGIDVHLYEREREHEVRIRRTGGLRKYVDFGGAILRREAFLRREEIGLVHMNNSPMSGFSDWLPAARLRRIPCMTFAMGDAEMPRSMNRWFARRFDHVIACSRYIEQAMGRIGVPAERLSWTYLGIDAAGLRAEVRAPAEVTRRQLGIPPEGVLVLMTGNLREWKGQHVLLDALRHLAVDVKRRLHIRFVGAATTADADYVRSLEARIASMEATERVTFLGARDDVPTLLAASDIAVHASVIPEPFGLVVPEAMAQGTAVIASQFGGPGELITTAIGCTFDPSRPAELAAHLDALVRDPARRRQLGDAARRRADEHDLSVEAMVARVESVYRKLLP